MDIRNRKGLKQAAIQALEEAPHPPRKLFLLHAGIALSLSLLVTVINFILERQIGGTGGLSGIGLRSILSTAQNVLILANTVLLPFWEIGLLFAALSIGRKRQAQPDCLLFGFRRFGPVLRLNLLKFALVIAAVMVSLQVGMAIFMATPLSKSFFALIETIPKDGVLEEMLQDEALVNSMISSLTPMYLSMAAVMCVILIPVSYYLRMADYLIMDMDSPRALVALIGSFRMMRYHCFDLLKLDLSFWWYYGLTLLCAALGYADALLPLIGISLPINPDVAMFLFYGIYLLAQLALAWFAGSYVQTTYAKAYDSMLPEEEPSGESTESI